MGAGKTEHDNLSTDRYEQKKIFLISFSGPLYLFCNMLITFLEANQRQGEQKKSSWETKTTVKEFYR